MFEGRRKGTLTWEMFARPRLMCGVWTSRFVPPPPHGPGSTCSGRWTVNRFPPEGLVETARAMQHCRRPRINVAHLTQIELSAPYKQVANNIHIECTTVHGWNLVSAPTFSITYELSWDRACKPRSSVAHQNESKLHIPCKQIANHLYTGRYHGIWFETVTELQLFYILWVELRRCMCQTMVSN